MDHSCGSGDSISSREQYLSNLNKLSHKISKPSFKKPSFEAPPDQGFNFRPPAAAPPQSQPPVYNINKSDFRDVVQKLTGSPAHERFAAAPPPIHAPKPQSSRLQRIRPPPLAHVSNRPDPALTCARPPNPNPGTAFSGSFVAPMSPLPPLPAVHAAAESPVSAYMRFLQNPIDPNPKQFSGFSPQPQFHLPPPPPQGTAPPPQPPPQQQQFQFPPSPLPFGCFNSPKSPYPLLSPGPGGLFSPSSGFPQFPPSPKVPVSSPRWRDI